MRGLLSAAAAGSQGVMVAGPNAAEAALVRRKARPPGCCLVKLKLRPRAGQGDGRLAPNIKGGKVAQESALCRERPRAEPGGGGRLGSNVSYRSGSGCRPWPQHCGLNRRSFCGRLGGRCAVSRCPMQSCDLPGIFRWSRWPLPGRRTSIEVVKGRGLCRSITAIMAGIISVTICIALARTSAASAVRCRSGGLGRRHVRRRCTWPSPWR
jgi:hypothetical protein